MCTRTLQCNPLWKEEEELQILQRDPGREIQRAQAEEPSRGERSAVLLCLSKGRGACKTSLVEKPLPRISPERKKAAILFMTEEEGNTTEFTAAPEEAQSSESFVYLYIVQGRNQYLHIALAKDIEAQLAAIQRGEGPQSLKGKTPVKLVYVRRYPSFSEARKIAKLLKVYTRERKERLIEAYQRVWQQTTDKSLEHACQISEIIGFPPVKPSAKEGEQ